MLPTNSFGPSLSVSLFFAPPLLYLELFDVVIAPTNASMEQLVHTGWSVSLTNKLDCDGEAEEKETLLRRRQLRLRQWRWKGLLSKKFQRISIKI